MDYVLYYDVDKQGRAGLQISLINTIQLKALYLSENIQSIGVRAVRSTRISESRYSQEINAGAGIDGIKKQLFRSASGGVNLTFNSNIDAGADIDGKHVMFKLFNRYDELTLGVEKTEDGLTEQDKFWVDRLNTFKTKYEIAGESFNALTLNRKLYSFGKSRITTGKLEDYEYFKDYAFMGGEINLGEVYLLGCTMYGLESARIKHFSGRITKVFSCRVEVSYISYGSIFNTENSEIKVHNANKFAIDRVYNCIMHLYDVDWFHVASFNYSTLHFHKFIGAGYLMNGNVFSLLHSFVGAKLIFHEGIDFNELLNFIQNMLANNKIGGNPYNPHIEVYIPLELQKSILGMTPKHCKNWIFALEDFK